MQISVLQKVRWNLSIRDTIGTTKTVLYMEVSLIQRLNNAIKYYCGMRGSTIPAIQLSHQYGSLTPNSGQNFPTHTIQWNFQ